MNPATSTIDRLLGAARRRHGTWPPVVLGAVALGAAYLIGENRNLLYLSLLLAAAVIVSLALRRWWTVLLGLGACAYIACVPAEVRDLGALYPAPRDIPGAENMWVTGIGPDETWTYRFTVGDLGKPVGGADPNGLLYIDGRNLANLVVSVQERTVRGSAFSVKKNGLDHVAIPLGPVRAGVVTVELRGSPSGLPKIFHGPEVHGLEVYRDAVWLEFTAGGNRSVYHAQRSPAPSLAK